jgi:5-formyltetrahydrofolate cyclo-ligase
LPQLAPPVAQVREQRSKTAFAGSAIPSPAINKSALRKQLRAERRTLPQAEHQRQSRAAEMRISRLARFRHQRRIAVYLPIDREVDTAALRNMARRRGVLLYVPVIAAGQGRQMRFAPLRGPLRSGKLGLREPRERAGMVGSRWLNMIVAPLVAIDSQGRRLGMGGGYYDRALAYRRQRTSWRGPVVVGLAFDLQCVASIGGATWDVALDGVATARSLKFFSRGVQ